jgi:acyl-coenzyme A thioesterase PaaI-like protein
MSASNDHERSALQLPRVRIQAALEAMPYARHLGIRLAGAVPGDGALFHLPFDARLIGNVTLPALHGGVVASFMQIAAIAATWALTRADVQPKLVDFSLDFLSSAGPSDIFAQCEFHRVGKRIAAVGVRCWQRSSIEPVALGRAHLFVAPSA